MKKAVGSTRRGFIRSTAGTLFAPTIVPASALGHGAMAPSDRVTVGLIGSGQRAMYEAKHYVSYDNCEVVAVCDPQESRRLEAKQTLEKLYGEHKRSGTYRGIRMYNDFREVLRQKDIDAVYNPTPDHWHVPTAIAALKAGKHLHAEKPLGTSVAEDLALSKALRKHPRVCQYGAERRSTPEGRHAVELVLNGRIGEVKKIYVLSPGSELGGSATPVLPVPKGFDYDLWLGPAPEAPFCKDRCLNSGARKGIFHIRDYCLGFIAGWGAHPLDIVQWWADNAGFTIPVTYEGAGKLPQEGLFNCAYEWDLRCTYESGLVMRFLDYKVAERTPDVLEPSLRRPDVLDLKNAAIFFGTQGWVAVSYTKILAEPASLLSSEINTNEKRLVQSPRDDRQVVATSIWEKPPARHQLGWIQCIQSGAPTVSPLESAVRSDLISQLSDICIRTGRTIRWDPRKETIVGDEGARKMMSRPMRKPWTLS